MENASRKAFLAAAAASAAGATGVIASQRQAEAMPATGKVKVEIIRDIDPDYLQDVEWHLGPGGFTLIGYSVDQYYQYFVMAKQIA